MAGKRIEMPPAERLFMGLYPTGLVFADKAVEIAGDYKRLGYINYERLVLEQVAPGCPPELLALMQAEEARMQAKRGERFETSACGQYVFLGGAQ
jgi:hypothetical protein